MLAFLILIISLLLTPTVSAQPVDLEEQVRAIATELRCVVCQNLSVADSPSELAQQMRALIREELQKGKTPEEIKSFFVSKYGEWVLLAPKAKGFNLIVWVLPFAAVLAGTLFVVFIVRRWTKKESQLQAEAVDLKLIERLQRQLAEDRPPQIEPEADDPRSLLWREQNRLLADLRELEFDYQAGKLSEADYQELRRGLEGQAAQVLKELDATPNTAQRRESEIPESRTTKREAQRSETRRFTPRGWRLAAGGVFLLLFGVTLGVLLTKSLRPRQSEMDNITGDFLTGTGPGGIGGSSGMAGMEMGKASSRDLGSLLGQGRSAFERQEWPQAIEAFKKVLSIDRNHPEAHTYMGLILAQAGHADGALLAFERALSTEPNFPLALWGKGMLLYRAKEDFSGARETLEKLLSQMPPGKERDEVQTTISELASMGGQQKDKVKKPEVAKVSGQVQGTISIDPKLKERVDAKAVLFIIARAATSQGGPPLAVKKIDRPVFPVFYSLGPENVMMAGVPLSGKVVISARLDKDGDPMTREPGNLTGEYKNNPVEVGSRTVDIVIDHVM